MIRRLHILVFITIWVVIAALLTLQLTLNSMKFKGMMTHATADLMQVSASNLEAVISRAEKSGLALTEIDNLGALIQRELESSQIIESVWIFAPNGEQILGEGVGEIPPGLRVEILRRASGRNDVVSDLEEGDKLYTTRKLFDSTSSMMAIVVLSTSTSVYEQTVSAVNGLLRSGHLRILLVVTLCLIPAVLIGFKSIARVISTVDGDFDTDGQVDLSSEGDTALARLRQQINVGKSVYDNTAGIISEIEKKELHGEKTAGIKGAW